MKNKKRKFDGLFGSGDEGQQHISENNTKREIVVKTTEKHVIKIAAKTVTPLLQIDGNGGQRVKYIYEDGRSGPIPFFSSNGIRGVLRRIMTAQQIEAAKKANPDFSVSPDLFYLYAQGAALDKVSMRSFIPPREEEQVRKAAPIVSLFGAGLSGIEGKLAVTDLEPRGDVKKFEIGEKKDGTAYTYSALMDTMENFRTDAIKSAVFRTSLGLDYDSISRWSEEFYHRVVEENKKKKSGDKEAISHIAMPHTLPMIIPGVSLYTSIGSKYGFALSEVELGGIVSALKELSVMQIGSAKRIGFGILDWEVRIDNTLLIRSESSPEYALDRKLTVTPEGEAMISAWEKWLDENAVAMEEAVSAAVVPSEEKAKEKGGREEEG